MIQPTLNEIDIDDVQNFFCEHVQCDGLNCEDCLFSRHHTEVFKDWFKETGIELIKDACE